MSQALRRGSVVLRAEQYGVVWTVLRGELVLLPIIRDDGQVRSGDVVLNLPELLAAAIAVPDARVRVDAACRALAEGQIHVGELVGTTLCRVVLAVARACHSAETEMRWTHERMHRAEAGSVAPVRI